MYNEEMISDVNFVKSYIDFKIKPRELYVGKLYSLMLKNGIEKGIEQFVNNNDVSDIQAGGLANTFMLYSYEKAKTSDEKRVSKYSLCISNWERATKQEHA